MYSQSLFTKLPAEISEQIYSYLPPESARNAAMAEVSNVFRSEYNQRLLMSSKHLSLDEAFGPTLGYGFTKLLFEQIIFLILRNEITSRIELSNIFLFFMFQHSNLSLEYYHVGNRAQLQGILLYADPKVELMPDNIAGYFDDDYRYHITGDTLSFIVNVDVQHVHPRNLTIKLVSPDKIIIHLTDSSEYIIIKFRDKITGTDVIVSHTHNSYSLFKVFDDKYDILRRNNPIDEALSEAAQNGFIDVIKYLVHQGADVHADQDLALGVASRYGQLGVVQYLLENGLYAPTSVDLALVLASAGGHLDVVNYLLGRGANIQERAFLAAEKFGHKYVIEVLSKHNRHTKSINEP